MGINYFGRASLVAAYLLTLGSIPLLSQTNTKQDGKPQVLEKRIVQQSQQANVDTQSLHYQLLNRINALSEELLPTTKPKIHWGDKNVCDSIGYLVYDDLARLASRFNRAISLDGLCVYAVNDEIIVDNKFDDNIPGYRLVFYPNKTAIEVPVLLSFEFEAIKIKVTNIKGREVVEEKRTNNFFSYIPDADGYSFSRVHRRVSGLNKAFDRLRKAKPPKEGPGDPKDETLWYQLHPLDAPKFWYIRDQLSLIASGFFERYGLPLSTFWDFRQEDVEEVSTVNTTKGMIRVYGYTHYSQELDGFQKFALIVRDRPEARKTTTVLRKNMPNETTFETLVPVQK